MVLDRYDEEMQTLIFKNTFDSPEDGPTRQKRFEIVRTHDDAPDKLFFVHIDVPDIDNLPDQDERKDAKEAVNNQKLLPILFEIEKKRRKIG